MNYGLKAPKLDDGSLLLQELKLDAEQTAQIKSDRAELASSQTRAKRAYLVWLAVETLIQVGAVFLIFSNSFAWTLFGLFGIVVSLFISRYRKQGPGRLAQQMIEIVDKSKVSSEVVQVFKRYMPGDRGIQRFTYLELVMKGDTVLGNNSLYRVRMDTTNESGFVVREVILPEPA